MTVRVGVALVIFMTVGGCSVLLDPAEPQCRTNGDCAARGFGAEALCSANVCQSAPKPEPEPQPEPEPDPVWGCLGRVPKPIADPSKTLSFGLTLKFLDKSPVTAARLDVCEKADFDCTGTDRHYPKGLAPDSSGTVALTVLHGFEGFFRVTGSQFIQSRFYVGQQLISPPNIQAVNVIKPDEHKRIVEFAGQKVDPARGTAIFFVQDCSARSVGGVTFSSPNADPQSQVFYLITGLPALPPGVTHTDAFGLGGFLNMPVGTALGVARRASDSAFVGQSTFSVFADSVSFVFINPTPS